MRRARPIWLTAAYMLLVVCTAAVTWHHEAWLDETDPWLLMRDGGVATMLARTGSTGAPALWYLLIAPLVGTGLPFQAQQILNLVIVWAALWLFVWKAPFRPLLKLAFLFSYFAGYEFSVIARAYGLLMALLFGIAALWSERMSRPVWLAVLTVLLANVAGQGLIIAAAVGATFLFEALQSGRVRQPGVLAALLVMLAGGAAAALQMVVPPDGPRVIRHFDAGTIPYAIGAMLFPFSDPRLSFFAGLLMLLVATLAAGRSLPPLLLMSGAVGTLLAFYQFVWYGGVRHSGILLVVVLSSLWIASTYRSVERWRGRAFGLAEAALALGLALSIPLTLRSWRDDFRFPFSGSREMAAFISRNVPPSAAIAAHPPIHTEAILAYLPGRRFWYVVLGRYGSYMPWGRVLDEAQLRAGDGPAAARRQFGPTGWFLVSAGMLSDPAREGLRLVYSTRTAFGVPAESYWLYEPVAGSQ